MGRSLCNMVKQTFQESELPHGINNTLIQLIPKVPSPQSITQFRPISLCNVTYKVITKIIVDRLKILLPSLVSPTQSSFVLGGHII